MLNVGDVIEQDGVQMRVVEVREQTYDDGSTVTIVTTEQVDS